MNISDADRANIERLRNAYKLFTFQLTPYYDTDFNLLRWLQGHENNFEIIVPKLKNHLLLRKSKLKLDELADRQRNHPVHHHWKCGITGPALVTPNAIVNIEQTGSNDFWGMLQTYSSHEVFKARVLDLETMLRAVMEMEEKTGEQASVIYVMDLSNLSYNKRLISLMTGPMSSISSFMSEHYVELVHTSFAKPLIPEKTRNKVKIFGSNWRQEMLKLAVPEVLPAFWNEPNSNVFKADVERAVPLDPKNYYVFKELENMETLSIPPGKVDFFATKGDEGQVLSWTIVTDGNFGYALYWTNDEKETDVTKMEKIFPGFMKVPGPTKVPIKDDLICEKTGFYKLWISNEHAWFHTLRISCNFFASSAITPSDYTTTLVNS
uniref:CRAL-TRIO domain-containing protein n=1 Tax=Syphacia muris TaxID=451379 RepID=A0A0N5AZC6_9BILA